jgi:hypothetical protein
MLSIENLFQFSHAPETMLGHDGTRSVWIERPVFGSLWGKSMMSKCANPACSTPFQYLREGRLFKFELQRRDLHLIGGEESKSALRVEHFWLCGRCAAVLTLSRESSGDIKVVPLQGRPKRAQVRRAVAS